MPRLSRQDRARAREIEGMLATLVDGAAPVLESVMPALREYLRTERSLAYGVRLDAEGCELAFLYPSGWGDLTGRLEQALGPWIRSSRGRFGLYDAARVEAGQRNRPITMPRLLTVLERTSARPSVAKRDLDDAEATRRVFEASDLGSRAQLRALVCDGPRLLAWVGGFQPDGYDPVQKRRLAALVPALTRRLRLEDRLATSTLHAAALPALLERVPGASFIVDEHGRIHLANATGCARYDRAPRKTAVALRQAAARRIDPHLEVTPLAIAAAPPAFLVTERTGRRDSAGRLAASARRYGLTPRETEVLSHLVQGASNRAIALELGCSERTVEVHVAHLLDKFGAPSRSALVARFWMDG